VNNDLLDYLLGVIASIPNLKRQAMAEEVDGRFRSSFRAKRGAKQPDPLHFATLARLLNYYALGLSEKGKGPTERLSPKWTKVVERFNSFIADRNPSIHGLPEINDDDLRQFCSFSSRSMTQGFYFAIALFLLHEKANDSLGSRQLLEFVLPASEAHFLEELTRELAEWLRSNVASASKDPVLGRVPPPRRARRYPEVELRFAYEERWRERFTEFLDHHGVDTEPGRLGLHLIVYRSREGRPGEVVKSFLSLAPHKNDALRGGRGDIGSVHVFRPAQQDLGYPRLGLGWTIPLECGFYVVGGQKSETERAGGRRASRPLRLPFRGIETFYFSWRSFDSQLLYGLAMSLNNDGTPLISRVCARPTPHNHSDRVILGNVALPDLAKSIMDDDRRAETRTDGSSLPAEVLAHFDLVGEDEDRAVELARVIAHHCNNTPRNPRDWDVEPGAGGAVNRSALGAKVDELVLGGREATSPLDGRPLGFWGGLRLGPLTNDGN
jgi:hypothetical protein